MSQRFLPRWSPVKMWARDRLPPQPAFFLATQLAHMYCGDSFKLLTCIYCILFSQKESAHLKSLHDVFTFQGIFNDHSESFCFKTLPCRAYRKNGWVSKILHVVKRNTVKWFIIDCCQRMTGNFLPYVSYDESFSWVFKRALRYMIHVVYCCSLFNHFNFCSLLVSFSACLWQFVREFYGFLNVYEKSLLKSVSDFSLCAVYCIPWSNINLIYCIP